jgi:hypothetical protein
MPEFVAARIKTDIKGVSVEVQQLPEPSVIR